VLPARFFRGGGEGHHGARDLGLGEGDRLARLAHNRLRKLRFAPLDPLRHRLEQRGALMRGRRARLWECGLRGADRALDLRRSTHRHARELLAGVWIDDGRPRRGVDPFARDEQSMGSGHGRI
jgi:hypothetical protein